MMMAYVRTYLLKNNQTLNNLDLVQLFTKKGKIQYNVIDQDSKGFITKPG